MTSKFIYTIISVGRPAKIRLTTCWEKIKDNGQDLNYIAIEVTDKREILNSQANNQADFSIEGKGKVIAVVSSGPTNIESFQQPSGKAVEEKCMVIVQSTNKPDKIVLSAKSKGLTLDKVTISTK